MLKSTSLLIISLLLVVNLFSQVGIGTSNPNSSAILDLTSNNKGFLPSRIALSGRNDVTTIPNPATGLLIYNTATAGSSPNNVSPGYYYYNGASWISIATGSFDATIDFSINSDPNTAGTTFSPNVPQSKDYVYVSTIDGSQWTWNGSVYIIYLSARSPFYINNTTNDAGNSKTSAVYRNAAIGINQSNPKYGLDVSNSQIRSLNATTTNQVLLDPMDTVGPKIKLGTSSDSIKFMEIIANSSANNIDNKSRDFKIFSTSASNALVVKSLGNVGLGVSSPSTKLDVNGAGLFRNGNTNNSFSNDQILFGFLGTSNYQHSIKSRHASSTLAGNSIDFYVWNQATDATTTVGTKHIMTLDGNGNVGIGSTTPPNPLSIVTNVNIPMSITTSGNGFEALKINSTGGDAGINLYGGNNYWAYQSSQSDGSFRINDRGANNAIANAFLTILKSSGYVGLSTNVPTTTLDVNGSGLFRQGNGNATFTNNQLLFGYAGTSTYMHAIKTRHFSGSQTGNAIDFYVWDQAIDSSTAVGSKQVLTLDGTGNVGIATSSPTSTLHSNGSRAGGITTISTSTTLSNSEFVRCTGSSSFTITLPNASSCIGRVYNIRNHNTQTLAISSYKDASNNFSTSINSNALLRIVSDGIYWIEF